MADMTSFIRFILSELPAFLMTPPFIYFSALIILVGLVKVFKILVHQ